LASPFSRRLHFWRSHCSSLRARCFGDFWKHAIEGRENDEKNEYLFHGM